MYLLQSHRIKLTVVALVHFRRFYASTRPEWAPETLCSRDVRSSVRPSVTKVVSCEHDLL